MSEFREGNLEKARRKPHDWKNPDFWDEQKLEAELERVYDICHTCRRCVSLCESFPTLFDLVDESETMELDSVDKADFGKVVDQCFMCDLCAETKCPYLPPHEFDLDFPHLMLRAKAVKFAKGDAKWRDRLITSTDAMFSVIGQPGIAAAANLVNGNDSLRGLIDNVADIHPDAPLPTFHSHTFKDRQTGVAGASLEVVPAGPTKGRVALYTTCFGNYNEPQLGEDLAAVLTHNGVPMKVVSGEKCCGMPKFELGDLKAVEKLKEHNIPILKALADEGWDLLSPIPSCVLMFKQELPLLFPDDPDVAAVAEAFFDPFEYLMARHKAGVMKTDFEKPLGKVAYHAACHQRVQNIGQKTKELLSLVPDTQISLIERCSGHDGTYAYKTETHEKAVKIARPVVNRVKKEEPEHFGSDCPMAGRMIQHGLKDELGESEHPITMLRVAYGL